MNTTRNSALEEQQSMADIPGWLRGFQRARASHTAPECLDLSGEVNEGIEEMQGAQSTPKKPFYQTLGRYTASSSPGDWQYHWNQVEQIWHNPDPDQMAETLKVAMMTQSSFDPLQVPFNSCILHVLEAYHQMREELMEKDRKIGDLKESHENDIRTLKQQELWWKGKEDEYRNEVKKLEVLLATGARGLELVTLARSLSTINGSIRNEAIDGKQAKRDIKLEHVASNGEPMMSDFAEKKDSFTSTNYTSQRGRLDARGGFVSKQTQRSGGSLAPGHLTVKTDCEDYKKDKDFNNVRSEQLYPIAYNDTSFAYVLKLDQEAEQHKELYPRPPRDQGSNGRHPESVQRATSGGILHRDILTHFKGESVVESSYRIKDENRPFSIGTLTHKPATHHRGFSFIPGDDFGDLSLVKARLQNSIQTLDDDGSSGRPPSSFLLSNNASTNQAPIKNTRRPRPVIGIEGERDTARNKIIDCYNFEPEHSSSQSGTSTSTSTSTSVVGMDQHADSSKGLEYFHNTVGLPQDSRPIRRSEATIAAVRALAESERMVSRAT